MTEASADPEIRSYCFCLPEVESPQVLGAIRIGDVNTGFAEQSTVHFLRPSPDNWSLRIDDEPLPVVEKATGLAWSWTPGFFAGEVTAELVDPGGAIRSRFLLDVAPHPSKLGRDVYAEMVREIWNWDPGLVLGEEPATTQVGTRGDNQGLLIAFARLRRHAPHAVHSLWSIAKEPIRQLRARRDRVSLCRVRRIDMVSIGSLVRNPALAVSLLGEGMSATHDIDPGSLMDIPSADRDLDCAANRAMTESSRRLLARVRSVHGQLQEAVQKENPSFARTSLAARWAVRRQFLIDLEHQLSTVMRQEPYVKVTRPEITAAGLTAISSHPVYANAYRRSWLAYAHGVDGLPTDERLWTSPTWEIFERWCFVRMLRVIEPLGLGPWKRRDHHPTNPTAGLKLPLPRSVTLTLLLQPNFPAADQGGSGHHSISGLRLPDIVLVMESETGCRWFTFDAKYRTTRANLLDAMASAHIYHDALRYRGTAPEQALLLAPGAQGVDWLLEAAFQRQHGVGIVTVRPDGDWGWLLSLLTEP